MRNIYLIVGLDKWSVKMYLTSLFKSFLFINAKQLRLNCFITHIAHLVTNWFLSKQWLYKKLNAYVNWLANGKYISISNWWKVISIMAITNYYSIIYNICRFISILDRIRNEIRNIIMCFDSILNFNLLSQMKYIPMSVAFSYYSYVFKILLSFK